MKCPLISTPSPSRINIAYRTHPPTVLFDARGISRNRLHESLRNTEAIVRRRYDTIRMLELLKTKKIVILI